VGPKGRPVEVISLFDNRRDHCAQFCALCAQICALSRYQAMLLGSDGSHYPMMYKPILRQGFSCYLQLPNDHQLYRRFLLGTQLTSRGSQVRNLHRPYTFGLLQTVDVSSGVS
jgi:hypothetical protein